jgi:hypothetical protein
MRLTMLFAMLTAASIAAPAAADEAGFLKPLSGSWTGSGKVTRKIGSSPINVSCRFQINTPGTSISMKGNCRGMLVINRAISADLTAQGARYSGTYVGPSGAPSQLSGGRQGEVINLAVRWARIINGDRTASMSIRKQGNSQLSITTTDNDPASGKSVVTSQINLRRQ